MPWKLGSVSSPGLLTQEAGEDGQELLSAGLGHHEQRKTDYPASVGRIASRV